MKLEPKDQVWNRACLLDGGPNPGPGDRALTDALSVHGLVMIGGVRHAVEVVGGAKVQAAAIGFEYFGLHSIAELLREVAHDPRLRDWNENTESEANRRYWEVLPDESELAARFAQSFRLRPEDFASPNLSSKVK